MEPQGARPDRGARPVIHKTRRRPATGRHNELTGMILKIAGISLSSFRRRSASGKEMPGR